MANEDFTTYTEVDTLNRLTVTASKITGDNVVWTVESYVYKDFGVDYFDNLDIDFEIYCEDQAFLPYGVGAIGFSNAVDDLQQWGTGDISCAAESRGSDVVWIKLRRGAYAADASDYYVATAATLYYCTMSRAAGGDTVTVEIYSDAARTNLLDTLSVSGYGTIKRRYAYGFVNIAGWVGGPDRVFDGYIQNLNLGSPTVTTQAVTDISLTTATGNGNITDIGDSSVTQHGVCWSTSADPTTADSKTEDGAAGTGAFTSAITDLTANTLYHVRAYATNARGTSYGADVEFTTQAFYPTQKRFIPRIMMLQ